MVRVFNIKQQRKTSDVTPGLWIYLNKCSKIVSEELPTSCRWLGWVDFHICPQQRICSLLSNQPSFSGSNGEDRIIWPWQLQRHPQYFKVCLLHPTCTEGSQSVLVLLFLSEPVCRQSVPPFQHQVLGQTFPWHGQHGFCCHQSLTAWTLQDTVLYID